MTYKDLVKAKVQSLVLEIMELYIGCYVLKKNWGDKPYFVKAIDRIQNKICVGRDEWGMIAWMIEDTEILGRPIQLADVLRAIGMQKDIDACGITLDGQFVDMNYSWMKGKWNLSTDFDNQSDDTIRFIGSLLGVCERR